MPYQTQQRAIIWARVSRREQSALEKQADDLRKHCITKNYVVIAEHVFIESTDEDNRRGYPDLMQYLKTKLKRHYDVFTKAQQKQFDVLVVWHSDRISRDAILHFWYVDTLINEFDVRIESITQTFEKTTPMGLFVYYITILIGWYENMVKKLRIPLGQRQQAEKGRGVGRCPMGYVPIGTKHNTRWEVSEPNATFVKELFAHYLSGSSLKKLPLMFAYVDKKGKKVHMSWQGILFLLQNKAYCGYINYKGELIKGTHTPLVSEQEFEKIQIELKRRKDL